MILLRVAYVEKTRLKKAKNSKANALESYCKKLYTVSFFELIYASARIDKFLLAGKERMTL